jgi:hypothetical protein
MDILIFLAIGNLIAFSFLIGIPVLIARAAFRAGRTVGEQKGIPAARWIFFLLVVGVPSAWIAAGYLVFEKRCSTLPKPEFLSHAESKPISFLVDDRALYSFHRWASVRDLLEVGKFRFYEKPRPEGGPPYDRAYSRRDLYGPEWRQLERISIKPSQYGLVFSELHQASDWWLPPIYLSNISVQEVASGKVLAKASELVYGGGIVGLYLRMIGRDQDYDYLSCGYISKEIGAFRPSLVANPRHGQYQNVEGRLVLHALTPRSHND